MEWIVWPADDAAPDFNARWAAFDLADLCKLYGVRVVHGGGRVLAVFHPTMEAELVAATSEVLADARPYLSAHLGKLPALAPADAVEIIKDIMRAHKSLQFCRGEAGSRWPIYPRGWTAGQRATVQSLWFVAGDALDSDAFVEVDQ